MYQAAEIIREMAHPDVNIIFGAVIDPELEGEVQVTVIATGFDTQPRREAEEQAVGVPALTVAAAEGDNLEIPAFLRRGERAFQRRME